MGNKTFTIAKAFVSADGTTSKGGGGTAVAQGLESVLQVSNEGGDNDIYLNGRVFANNFVQWASEDGTGQPPPWYLTDAPQDGNTWGRNNGNWVIANGGGSGEAVWGGITGTLSNQSDLQSALDAKADSTDFLNYLPLTGGTLTGQLNGTTASFSGDVTSNKGTESSAFIVQRNTGGSEYTTRIENANTGLNGGTASITHRSVGVSSNTLSLGVEQSTNTIYAYTIGASESLSNLGKSNRRFGNGYFGGYLKVGTSSNTSNYDLLHFDTERGWKFRKESAGASTKLVLRESSGGKSFVISGPTEDVASFTTVATVGGDVFRVFNYGSGGTTSVFRVSNTGVVIATSTVTATNFIQGSDPRLKEDIKDYSPKSLDINLKTYTLKSDKTKRTQLGVLSTETDPMFVHEDEDGMQSVNYIQLLLAKVGELEERIKILEK